MKRIEVTYVCDYCGRVINPDETISAITPGRIGYEHKFIPNHDGDEAEVLHYHDYCLENLLSMRYKPEEEEQAEEVTVKTEPETSTVLEPRPKRGKPVDTGKIGALAKRGWTPKAIADDMGIAESTVYKHLKGMKITK